MESYLNQLLDDIRHAHRSEPVGHVDESHFTFAEQMEEVEKWVEGSNAPPTLGRQCGLSVEQFPPQEKLKETEIEKIMDAFMEMLSTWNLSADFPDNLPYSLAYPLLINLLDEEAWYLPGGTLRFDFCTGYAHECQLKEYCPCLKYWNEESN